MNAPGPQEQIDFLGRLQVLFEDSSFSATYKFALLMSLSDLAVESEGDGTGEYPISTRKIAEKYAELYWPQTIPYPVAGDHDSALILYQNKGKQAFVVNRLLEIRNQGVSTWSQVLNHPDWQHVSGEIAGNIEKNPVRYLQTGVDPFLYDYPNPKGRIVLKPGVVFLLRTFHPLIQQLARSGWVKHIRENRNNADILGRRDELEPFLFGTPRASLVDLKEVLSEIQSGGCFYCGKRISDVTGADVDHFIPWSKYPRDLLHNFVLADAGCNRSKSDMLAAQPHLARWVERNARFGQILSERTKGFLPDLSCSVNVARWAYDSAWRNRALGWVQNHQKEPLSEQCLEPLNSYLSGVNSPERADSGH